MCSNDCLLHSKYEYEYLSNYDFDEFILPRKHGSNYFMNVNFKENSSCDDFKNWTNENKINYNIIDYVKSLLKNYGSDVAYFHFPNVQYLVDFEQVKKQLLNINSDYLINYETEFTKLKYHLNNVTDQIYLKSMRDLQPYLNCLNESISKNNFYLPRWNNVYASVINNREGKSIYLTNNTLSYNQHYAWITRPNTKGVRLPVDVAFVCHLRDHDISIVRDYSSNELFLDLEYYRFIFDLTLR
ncbi:unnamed protein product [Brachionus calyciflorus]|uniref:Glycosyltransferase family 92 protein n=1 Tax=Brachionus calyciflorus TaxID=104777 RepID=A0A813U0W1_9BILA|nr:unnamed protein product [Brachionus calyciflorus]